VNAEFEVCQQPVNCDNDRERTEKDREKNTATAAEKTKKECPRVVSGQQSVLDYAKAVLAMGTGGQDS